MSSKRKQPSRTQPREPFAPAFRWFAVAALGWATFVFAVHARHCLKNIPPGFGPDVFIRWLFAEMAPGPNFARFWFWHLLRIAACALLFLGAWALGRRMLPWWVGRREDDGLAPLDSAYSLGLGLGIIGYLGLGLIIAGAVQRWMMIGFYAALCLFGVQQAVALLRGGREALGDRAARSHPGLLEQAVFVPFLLAAAMAFIGNTIPEIFYDALTYHLAVPQAYLLAGGMVDLPYNHYSYLPLLTSMLYFWGLASGGMYLAKIMNCFIGFCVLMGLYHWGRVLKDRALGLVACAIFVGTPSVIYLFWMCNADLGAAFFLLLALMSAWEWSRDVRGNHKTLRLTGIFCGLALASKYTAAFGIAPLTLFVSWNCWKRSLGSRAFLLFCFLAILPLLPWWARNVAFKRNPVFPYMVETFGPKDVDTELLSGWHRETSEDSPGASPLRHAKKLWEDAAFGLLPAVNYTGPLFVGFFILVLGWAGIAWVRLGVFYFCAAMFLGLSSTYIHRLLIPYYPPLALLVAFAAVSCAGSRSTTGIWAGVLLVAVLAFNAYQMSMILFSTSLRGLSVASGKVAPEEYLKTPRSLYPNPSYGAYAFIKGLRLNPRDRILVVGESRLFYAPGNAIGNAPHDPPVIFAWANGSMDPERLYGKMNAHSVEVVLWNRGEGARTNSRKYVNGRGISLIAAMMDRHFERVYRDSWTDVYRRGAAGGRGPGR